MTKLTVNDQEIDVMEGLTILQACEIAGVEIPRFCYHERLQIAGNCRMCLVEVAKTNKPVASCSQSVVEGMAVYTNTPMVKAAREGVMEFLLINHPLDCPICDQGGECDLQDQAMKYGRGSSRFREEKRAVKDKYMGPLIKTHMTRCIHCTRCIRFLEDVAGTSDLGTIGRGEHIEVSTYISKAITSELSGNIIDLCPVGALTSKPYAFTARNWELNKTESIDVLDAVGSNIRIDTRGKEVMRILPRLHEEVNEEWISDKARFSYDGLKYQRLDVPMVRINGQLQIVSWEKAFNAIAQKVEKVEGKKIAAIAGDLTDVETMLVMKELLHSIGSYNYDCRQDGSLINNKSRALYIFNTTIAGIEAADLCLIIGSNPRYEAAVLNARIRKAYLHGMKVALIGEHADLTYPFRYLGHSPWLIKQIAEGEHPYCDILEKAIKPMMIIGSNAIAAGDYEAVMYYTKKIAQRYNFVTSNWNGFNVLQTVASRVGGLDIGFIPPVGGWSTNTILEKSELLFLLGADEIDLNRIPNSTFVVYQGHHGDKSAYRADVVLPGAAYTEKDATYVNLEGRVQRTYLAVHPPGQAKPDWEAIAELSAYLGYNLYYKNIEQVREKMCLVSDIFKTLDTIIPSTISLATGRMKEFASDYLLNSIKNFYMTDSISRHSRTMASCIDQVQRDISG